MQNIVLLTAKGGNQSIEDKNIIDINGKPSMAWSIIAAQESSMIDEIFVTTECPRIKKVALDYNAKVIDRPDSLSQPLSNHGDVILHGAKAAAEMLEEPVETVTILLGNTVMNRKSDIDSAVKTVLENKDVDSCMTVWKAQDDHPMRAMTINQEGYLEGYLGVETPDTNRQSYQDVFYYDQGPWTVRMESLLRSEKTKEGPGAWWWMGKRCKAIQRIWVVGRDTHTQFDVDVAKWWLNEYGPDSKG
jgi:CMP-N-acetylneuraminic acid synthetase